jgi:hypothetical protein
MSEFERDTTTFSAAKTINTRSTIGMMCAAATTHGYGVLRQRFYKKCMARDCITGIPRQQ